QKENVRRYVFMSTSGVVVGAGLLLAGVQLWSVIVFMILFSICNPLAINTLTSYYYRLIGSLPLKGQLRIESVVMRELFLNVGRVLCFTLVVFFVLNIEYAVMPVILVVMAL